MKRIIIILLSLFTISSYAQNLGGVKVIDMVSPTSTDDQFPTHDAYWGKGGLRTVTRLTERDSITTARRQVGMFVYVTDSNKIYQLVGGITNGNWQEFNSGSAPIDTTSLSNRINLKLNKADTLYFLHGSDTTSLSNRINARFDSNSVKSLVNDTADALRQEMQTLSFDEQPFATDTIYVATTGSDVTGTGTWNNPYATIHKAIIQIPVNWYKSAGISGGIIIKLGAGTFTYDWATINEFNKRVHAFLPATGSTVRFPRIFIFGTPVAVYGDTLTFTKTTDYTYTTSNTYVNLTTNNYKGYFTHTVASPTIYYPICKNTAKILTVSPYLNSGTMAGIYTMGTILQPVGGYISSMPYYYFLSIDFTTNNYLTPAENTGEFSSKGMNFSYCNIYGSQFRGAYVFPPYPATFTNSVVSTYHLASTDTRFGPIRIQEYANAVITGCYLRNTHSTLMQGAGVVIYNGASASIRNGLYVENFYEGINNMGGECAINTTTWVSVNAVTFRKCYALFGFHDGGYAPSNPSKIATQSPLLNDSTSYILSIWNDVPIQTNKITINGTSFTSAFTPVSVNKKFIDYNTSHFITINGYYGEMSQSDTKSLINNSTDSISIGDKTYNRSITINYTINRSTQYRKGTIQVVITGAGTGLYYDLGSYTGNDCGVTLNGVYFGGTTGNTIKLKYTVDNNPTYGNGTFTFDAQRQNY